MCGDAYLHAVQGTSHAVWHSKQVASNTALRANKQLPEGFYHKRASATLLALRMERPFATTNALHPSLLW